MESALSTYDHQTTDIAVKKFPPVLTTPNAAGGGNEPVHENPRQSSYSLQRMLQQPTVIAQEQTKYSYGPDPIYVTCPACGDHGMSRIRSESCSKSNLCSSILCLFCCWIYVCADDSTDSHHKYCDILSCDECSTNTNHYCGNCNKFLGTYSN